jgi:hypothetical protein
MLELNGAFADDRTLAYSLNKKLWKYLPKHKRKWGNMATAGTFIYTYHPSRNILFVFFKSLKYVL